MISTASSGASFFFLLHQATQVLTLDVLHGDELHALSFAQVVDPDYVLVGDLGGQQQFLLEAVNDGLVAGQIRPDHFQSHHAVQFAVSRLVNRAHSAFAQNLQDFIALAQDCSGLKRGRALKSLDSRRGPHWRRRSAYRGWRASDHGGRVRAEIGGSAHHGW